MEKEVRVIDTLRHAIESNPNGASAAILLLIVGIVIGYLAMEAYVDRKNAQQIRQAIDAMRAEDERVRLNAVTVDALPLRDRVRNDVARYRAAHPTRVN